jgi:hypothetical protein
MELMGFSWEGWGPGTWLFNLPDLNLIENIWYILKYAIQKCLRQLMTEVDLIEAIKEECDKIDIEKINKLTVTMSDQLTTVRKAKGGLSDYQAHIIW